MDLAKKASRPELVQAAGIAELAGHPVCPGCHTAHPSLTMTEVTAGAYWECPGCGAPWDARRLATASAYAAWAAGREVPSAGVRVRNGGDV